MAYGGPAVVAKIILIIVNIVFILAGLLVAAIGIWLVADPYVKNLVTFIVPDESRLFIAAAALLIAIGAFTVFVSILGFIGTIMENAVLLGIYIALVAVVFCGELTAGIVAIVYQQKISTEVYGAMTRSVQSTMTSTTPYYTYNSTYDVCRASPSGKLWDYVQLNFDCCGVDDGLTSGFESSNIFLPSICPTLNLRANKPLTCCYHDPSLTSINSDNQTAFASQFNCGQIISSGCASAMVAWISIYAPVLIGIGLGIAMLQIFVMIFALCLCQHRKKDDQF